MINPALRSERELRPCKVCGDPNPTLMCQMRAETGEDVFGIHCSRVASHNWTGWHVDINSATMAWNGWALDTGVTLFQEPTVTPDELNKLLIEALGRQTEKIAAELLKKYEIRRRT